MGEGLPALVGVYRDSDHRAVQYRDSDPRAVQYRVSDHRAVQRRDSDHRAVQCRDSDHRAVQCRDSDHRAVLPAYVDGTGTDAPLGVAGQLREELKVVKGAQHTVKTEKRMRMVVKARVLKLMSMFIWKGLCKLISPSLLAWLRQMLSGWLWMRMALWRTVFSMPMKVYSMTIKGMKKTTSVMRTT
ncbi:hypothetical protein JZ751_004996 [Albula glossodonta]|uniref:Uncharacterized protein n=1 Tax=Albula glossodonta TaxID=121402 RepID=A0A8T2P567_9TELE|nr:hypothetical protein JZ751_004996 [Albula glossodonta]